MSPRLLPPLFVALFVVPFVSSACGDEAAAPDTTPLDTATPNDVFFPDGEVATTPDTAPVGDVAPGTFGAACQQNSDCIDGYCVEGPEGFVCTRSCQNECPDAFDCRGVQSGSADPVFLCLPRVAKVCVPCKADYQCTGGACLTIGGEGQCATNCTLDDDCPGGYVCAADANDVSGAHPDKYCQPRSGSCDCTAELAGAVRTCINENDIGTCYGVETCDPDNGWQGCSATTASAEQCDGRDNDCNALVDDGLETNVPCESETPGVGVCSGVRVCVGTQGFVCTAPVPSAERCDFIDNDCDGEIDNVPGRGQACVNTTGAGSCPGVNVCQEGELVCLGRTPSAEVCNYEDDDCDGGTDEGFGNLYETCSVSTGVCLRFGTVLCDADGGGSACNAIAGPSSPERCDGVDNDCNGDTDEAYVGLGGVCSDGQGVCRGFGTRACKADGSGTECSAVAASPSSEVCDLLDNNCDGATDEIFKNATGKYSTPAACGNCFTNCLTIFAKPNANGVCDTAPAVPVCKMACSNGYYDLNGVPDDGCEFRLETSAIYVSESDAAATDAADCGSGPSATGAGRKPCRSITTGMQRAQTGNKTKVLVAGGAYTESLTLMDGISIYGGYNPVNWVRDPESNLTALFGNQTSGHRKTVVAYNIVNKATVFDGFAVYGQVANGVGENSYAIWVRNSNGLLSLTNNSIWPGTGGPGRPGARGGDGTNGGDGGVGRVIRETNTPATYCFKTCTGTSAGGTAGVNATCGSTNGGAGGSARCPDFNESVDYCVDTTTSTAVQTNNQGGGGGSGTGGGSAGVGGCDQRLTSACTCILPGAIASCPNGQFGGPGGNGANGVAGARGLPSNDIDGVVDEFEWAGVAGNAGAPGGSGAGGGGGGAGGGVESMSACFDGAGGNDFGGTGGGGGAGGCGGGAGQGGTAGGGAFGIFYVQSILMGDNLPVIADNTIHVGFGGGGGRGGDGGTAGLGGNGGLGGAAPPGGTTWCAKPGAQGGNGGNGGPGGGGGGGNGGAAFGLYASGGSLPTWKTNNAYVLDGKGGAGGAGGGTGVGGNAGSEGLTGLAATHNLP